MRKIYDTTHDSEVREADTAPTLVARMGTGGNMVPLTMEALRVRKLMPVECERLQGMPDNYTRISWRGKPEEECPDGLRYKAIGNSWAVPVINWIGKRIEEEMK